MNRDILTKTIESIFEEKIKMIGILILTKSDIKHYEMNHKEQCQEIINDFKYKIISRNL